MKCYDENGWYIGCIQCIPKEGEEHYFGETLYVFKRFIDGNDGELDAVFIKQ